MINLTVAQQRSETYYYKRDELIACAYQLAMLRQRHAASMVETSTLRCAELHQTIHELDEYDSTH